MNKFKHLSSSYCLSLSRALRIFCLASEFVSVNFTGRLFVAFESNLLMRMGFSLRATCSTSIISFIIETSLLPSSCRLPSELPFSLSVRPKHTKFSILSSIFCFSSSAFYVVITSIFQFLELIQNFLLRFFLAKLLLILFSLHLEN